MRKDADVYRRIMVELSLGELQDLARELSRRGSVMTFHKSNDPFQFAVSRRMAGGPGGCACWDCRMACVRSTATFAALYADRVFVENPFWRHFSIALTDEEDIYAHYRARWEFAADVKALLAMKPLFKAGIVDLVTPWIVCCRRCIERLALGVIRFSTWTAASSSCSSTSW